MNKKAVHFYPPLEEKINIISHALGLLLSVLGFVLLLVQAISQEWVHVLAAVVYGSSMVILYAASTIYHRSTTPSIRIRLRVVDHAAIYVLIAGTYTPYMLITMPGTLGYSILAAAWTMAVVGIVIKLFYTGHFEVFSTLLYIAMGWAIVFAIKPLAANLAPEGLFWLMAGGIAYTVGAILYAIKQIPYNHAIFHLFVLMGSISHFISIYFYL
ncbi:PAQR family membrane homeostasis protein TrhA [Marinicella litoralis]|uniref:Channel protein (Hemolysin III family) n=1 Tax=Marinicella litoralis TaxID=644220 RepID=A0A4R6XYJ3_9GAMM|nr:hemolysin III family protein [Marinicella litoralis]TDR23307.1 channel protein (hemolysin III family) [Marinicella litoralis]